MEIVAPSDRSAIEGGHFVTHIDQWPFWLQMIVMLPHAVLAGALLWVWWPKSKKGLIRWCACWVYLLLFYFVFVR
jgi:hypothetical protein